MDVPASLKLLPTKSSITVERIQPMTADQLEFYLTHFSDEELRQVRELWQTHAARKELILFEATHSQDTHPQDKYPQGKYGQAIRI